MNYDKKNIEELGELVTDATALKEKAVTALSSALTDDLRKAMSKEQLDFLTEAELAFNPENLDTLDREMDKLNKLMAKGQKIM